MSCTTEHTQRAQRSALKKIERRFTMQKKRKLGEVIKVAAISLAMVGVFGAALMGANRLAFANAANRTMEVPPFAVMSATQTLHASATDGDMGVTIANALSAEPATRRNLTINEVVFPRTVWWNNGQAQERSETALSAEEAAQIGAQYIYEIFGECIDGAKVQMTFNGHMQHRGRPGVWTGVVGDGIVPEGVDFEMPLGSIMYIFLLNAETGEAIQVEYVAGLEEGMMILTPYPDDIMHTFEWHIVTREELEGFDIRFYREIEIESFNIWESHRWSDFEEFGAFFEEFGALVDIFITEWELEAGNPHIIRRFSTTTPPCVPQYPQGNGSGLNT